MTARESQIIEIELDTASLGARSAEIDYERKAAISDLIAKNHFKLLNETDKNQGPYRLQLVPSDRGVLMHISDEAETPLQVIEISLRLLRRNIRDYFMLIENYFEAVRQANPTRIEQIDSERRKLHSESGEMLRAALAEEVDLDIDTARRLFTLISVLHLHSHN